MVNLVHKSEDVLRQAVRPASEFGTKALSKLKDELISTMRSSKGIGIAATQIGHSVAAAIVKIDGKDTFVLNPRIISSDKWYISMEGCLSLPGGVYRVPRPAMLKVTYQTEEGVYMEKTIMDKLEAAIFHHEYSHLQGVLLDDVSTTSDPMSNYRKNRASLSLEQLREMEELAKQLSLFEFSKNNLKKVTKRG